MKDIFNFFEKPKDPLSFRAIRISLASPGEDPRVVARRGEEAGDDQLPHVQAGAGRPLLREDLRPGEGLRVQLRQVQAHEAPRRRLREVRRRGHPVQGASRAPRPHQPGHAGRAHLVPEEPAVAHRQHARHHAEGPGEGPLLRGVHRHRPEGDAGCSAASSSPRSATRKLLEESATTPSTPAWAARRSASCSRTSTSTRSPSRCAARCARRPREAKRKKIAKRLKVVEAFRESGNQPGVDDARR